MASADLTTLKNAVFSSGQNGAVYVALPEFEGIPALYQDSSGTTPTVSAGDPINYLVDYSGNGDDAVMTGSGWTLQGSPGDWWISVPNTAVRPIIPASAVTANTKTLGIAFEFDTGGTVASLLLSSEDAAFTSFLYVFLQGSTQTTRNKDASYTGVFSDGNQMPMDSTRGDCYANLTAGNVLTLAGLSLTGQFPAAPTRLLGYKNDAKYTPGGKLRGFVITEANDEPAVTAFLQKAYAGTLDPGNAPSPGIITLGSVSESESAPSLSASISGVGIGADYNMVLTSGQSLAVGYLSTPGLTTSQSYDNVMGNTGVWDGPVTQSGVDGPPDSTSFVPLVYTNKNANLGETIGLSACNHARSLGSKRMINANNAKGGRPISQLNKGTDFYNWGLDMVSRSRSRAIAESATFRWATILWSQGETDANGANSQTGYAADLIQYIDDINTDSGQSEPVKMIVQQMASHTVRGTGGVPPNIALAQRDAANQHPHIYIAAPTYMLLYQTDDVHLTNVGERLIGQYMGKVHHKVYTLGESWEPLQIKSASASGNTITLVYAPEVAPLRFDTTEITDPGNYGFEVVGKTITSVAVQNSNQVVLTLNQPAANGDIVRYAWGNDGDPTGPTAGARGNLCDSCTDQGLYGATLVNRAIIDEAVATGSLPTVDVTIGQASESETAPALIASVAAAATAQLGVATESEFAAALSATMSQQDLSVTIGPASDSEIVSPISARVTPAPGPEQKGPYMPPPRPLPDSAKELPLLPSQIPCPLAEGYGLQPENAIQSVRLETGQVRTRELWRNVPQQVNLKFRLNDYELMLLEGFLKHEAGNGAHRFRALLRLPNSRDLQQVVVHLVQMYQGPSWVDGSIGYWDVTLPAITIEDKRTTEDDYNSLILGMPIDEAFDLLYGGINNYWWPEYPGRFNNLQPVAPIVSFITKRYV